MWSPPGWELEGSYREAPHTGFLYLYLYHPVPHYCTSLYHNKLAPCTLYPVPPCTTQQLISTRRPLRLGVRCASQRAVFTAGHRLPAGLHKVASSASAASGQTQISWTNADQNQVHFVQALYGKCTKRYLTQTKIVMTDARQHF